ncbi:tetratricopeptide repeat protein [Methylocystis heyeri]|uniref:tetratricopeptide repeat protein n=1 Tax=Methylocystis heyeri TaxID=391905 RepID=UPI00113BCFCD|nr:tetratricopeptide repeat protein [Methylocystis heyeri]
MSKAALPFPANLQIAHAASRRILRPAAFAAISALVALSGCSKALNDVTGSIGRPAAPAELPSNEGELRRLAEEWGERYEKNTKNKDIAMTYARILHALDQNAQAVAVLQGAAIQYPQDKKVLSAYGKALADAGRLSEAADILSKAHTPERPDWSVMSAQGTIADQLGNHDAARNFYEEALKLHPNDPTVLSNLGLSYALSQQLPRAEETLLTAAAQPGADMRVRQNLALVLALEGKFSQAEEWSRRDLSPIDAAANVASIRQMISQSNTWRDIQQKAPATRRNVAARGEEAAPAPAAH